MKVIENLKGFEETKKIVESIGAKRDNLLPILARIHSEKKFISPEEQQIVAHLLGIHPVEVFSVVSFYHFYSTEHEGEIKIRLCKNISCKMAGADEIRRTIRKKLGIKPGEITYDGKFFFDEINCFGMCDKAPSVMINRQLHPEITPSKMEKLLNEILENGNAK